jgi:hypothetical protein
MQQLGLLHGRRQAGNEGKVRGRRLLNEDQRTGIDRADAQSGKPDYICQGHSKGIFLASSGQQDVLGRSATIEPGVASAKHVLRRCRPRCTAQPDCQGRPVQYLPNRSRPDRQSHGFGSRTDESRLRREALVKRIEQEVREIRKLAPGPFFGGLAEWATAARQRRADAEWIWSLVQRCVKRADL